MVLNIACHSRAWCFRNFSVDCLFLPLTSFKLLPVVIIISLLRSFSRFVGLLSVLHLPFSEPNFSWSSRCRAMRLPWLAFAFLRRLRMSHFETKVGVSLEEDTTFWRLQRDANLRFGAVPPSLSIALMATCIHNFVKMCVGYSGRQPSSSRGAACYSGGPFIYWELSIPLFILVFAVTDAEATSTVTLDLDPAS
ncbi:hypothetical protein EDB87DRAFT_1828134 [Lactarius vividus]|nr:hypothetical protein EDB87DRAFT_1828134 [Lactarius vividus]